MKHTGILTVRVSAGLRDQELCGIRLIVNPKNLIIGICLASGIGVSAGSVTLKPSADTGLSALNSNNNFGRTDSLILGGIRQSPTASRILLRFELGDVLPANAVITNASLKIKVTKKKDTPPDALVKIFRMNTPWSEGKKSGQQGGLGTAGEATWKTPGTNGLAWMTGGAAFPDFENTASASQTLKAEGTYTFTSQSLIKDLESWLANPASNQGWILIDGNESIPKAVRRIGSRESTANSPQLVIDFEVPPPPPVTVLNITPIPGAVEIRFSAPAGNLYTLQSRENLFESPWTAITNIAAKLTSLEPVIRDPIGNASFLFYRVLIRQID